MTPDELAAELGASPKGLRAWLRREYPRGADASTAWTLTAEQVEAARRRWAGTQRGDAAAARARKAAGSTPRSASDEHYVLDLLDELLGAPSRRQARFDWLRGDRDSRGAAARLPVDAYWPAQRLVVEYRERQHDAPLAFFDKPDRPTLSGVHRGEQRRRYDERREELIPKHGLRLLVVRPSDLRSDRRGRLLRDVEHDRARLAAMLATHTGPEPLPPSRP